MWQVLRRMAENPSGSDELAAFLAAVTALFVLFALTAYVVLMTLIWRAGHRGKKWREFVFPGLTHLRQHAWEYGLAALTSITLTATLFHKAAVVDAVLATDASEGAGGSIGRTVGEAGRSLLQMGQEAAVRREVRGLIEARLASDPALSTVLTRWLVIACFVLLALYLVRFLQVRMREARQPSSPDPGSGPEVRKLALVGVCLGLLLASPLPALGSEALVESAIRVLQRPGPTGTEREVESGVVSCACPPDSMVVARVAALEGAIEVLRRAASARDTLSVSRAELELALNSTRVIVDSIGTNLGALRQRVEALGNRGLLVVVTEPRFTYAVTSGAGERQSGRSAGLHVLQPGTYRVIDRELRADMTVDLVAGQSRVVDLRRRVQEPG
jgi:hypothetical protein